MYGLAVNLIMSVSGHPSIINEIETHARAFFPLNISALGSVQTLFSVTANTL